MSRLKLPSSLLSIAALSVGMSMGACNDPFIKPNNSVVVVMEDKRRVGEPHTDRGAITKPYRKKDKLTRKQRKARRK